MSPVPRLALDGLLLSPQRASGSLENIGLSLTIGEGECVALLATDAFEASSLIDGLAGHVPVQAGRILVDGHDVTARRPGQRGIGVLSERDPLFAHLSVRDNVAFPLAARRVREPERSHRVHQALALLGLEAQAGRRPAGLTPAEAIRASLARILVCDPGLVLLEDPFDRLDPISRRSVHQLLRRLVRARGLTLLLVTRDREEALTMGERIGILDGSRLRQLGPATELLDRPADERVAELFGEANRLTGQVEWVEDDVARVRLSAGPSLEAMAGEGLVAGALCVVCVRPERIAVAFVSGGSDALGADALGQDALAGTLSDMVHLGDHLRLRFRLAGGGEMLVRRPAAQPTSGLRIDRPALLAWQPAHAIAFAQEQDPEPVSGSGTRSSRPVPAAHGLR